MLSTFHYNMSESGKINLLNMNRQQLHMFFSVLGVESFRADQVMKWIYYHYCDDFSYMTNLQESLRKKLKGCAEIIPPRVVKKFCSYDGTVKWCFQVGAQQIETVYIPKNTRATLCISSQIGCALQCTFCSTGQRGFNRNLYVSEIVGQIWNISKIINSNKYLKYPPITNIVIMGMGEPLLNFNNIVTSIEIMLDNFGFGFSKRRVTLSTAGIVPAINKLSNILDISLAISLHAPNDFIRNRIMPINKKWNIQSLITAAKYYISKSHIYRNRITIEYVMLDNINDSDNCAYQLVKCLRGLPCKINLIPWNVIPYSIYRCSSVSRISRFVNILSRNGLVTTVRKIRGNDINAACGQLVGMIIDKKHNILKNAVKHE